MELTRFNDRLLEAAGGSRERLPDIAPSEVSRLLGGFKAEARLLFADIAPVPDGSGESSPWVWADPTNSFLTPFWIKALGIRAALVLVHRDPEQVVALRRTGAVADAAILDQWDRHNRVAMVHCSQWPSLVLSYEELVAKPNESIFELSEFVERCGYPVTGGAEEAALLVDRLPPDRSSRGNTASVGGHYRVLAQVLDQLDGIHFGDDDDSSGKSGALLEAVSNFYDGDYYGVSYDQSGIPYRRDEKHWVDFFSSLAGKVVETLAPRTALDVGCAIGLFVEALRNQGVDAQGIDVSRWAIDQVPPELRPFCKVGSITDELEGQFDLITCFEVLEHLPPSLAAESVANLCRHADAILFSSTHDDFDEPTHLNVEAGGYWAQLFHHEGFLRDVDFDASFLTPHAILFRRREVDVETLIADYERGLWNITLTKGAQVEEVIAEHGRLADRHNALAEEFRALGAKSEELASAVVGAERRRAAETLAAFDTVRHYELEQRRMAALVSIRDAEIDAIHQTKVFRYTAGLRRMYTWLRRRRAPAVPAEEPLHPPDGTYDLWVEQFDTIDQEARRTIGDRVHRLGHEPLLSVIMPVYNPPADLLRAAIDSVRDQIYTNWELCIADDCSSEGHVAEILAEYEDMDPRIKVTRRETNGHISAACNTALTMATGEWVGCLDQDDTLAEHALALVATTLADAPDAGIVYSDEDKLDGAGLRQ